MRRGIRPAGLAGSAGAIGAVTVLGLLVFARPAHLADVVMLYLLAIVLASLRWGLVASLTTSVLAVLALDYFFIPPFRTFAVSDVAHVPTFFVMFLVGVVISALTRRVRDQAEAARDRERRTASLYSLSDALSRARTTSEVAEVGAAHVRDVFDAEATVEVAQDGVTSAPSGGTRLPLDGQSQPVGALDVRFREPEDPTADRRLHLEAFARQIAGALERTELADKARTAQVRVETEQLRNSLLSSVSHDLRTPLAIITGAASALRDGELGERSRVELTDTILGEADRLNRLVRNLLDMTRLEAGAVEVRKEWQPMEEAVGAALARVERALEARTVVTDLDPDLPLVPFDSLLLQQVLVNLLENAAKYTPDATEVRVSAHRSGPHEVEVVVSDRGPGLSPGHEDEIFEKFYRAAQGRGGGVGLGLTICRGIIAAHGGRIFAANRSGGGAEIHFTLPIDGAPPSLDVPDSDPKREAAVAP